MTTRQLPDVATLISNVAIVVVAVPSTKPGFMIEIQRTSDDGTGAAASTGARSIAELPPAQTAGAVFVDHLPDNGAKWFYRGRHTGFGYAPSANWTAWTTGHRPVALYIEDMLTLEQTASWPVSRQWLPVSSGPLSKVLQLGNAGLIPGTSDTGYATGLTFTRASSTNPNNRLYRSVALPAGVTITEYLVKVFRGTTNETVQCTLLRQTSSATAGLATLTASTFGLDETLSTSLSEAVTTGVIAYLEEVQLFGLSSAGSQARYYQGQVTYTMPSYDKTY